MDAKSDEPESLTKEFEKAREEYRKNKSFMNFTAYIEKAQIYVDSEIGSSGTHLRFSLQEDEPEVERKFEYLFERGLNFWFNLIRKYAGGIKERNDRFMARFTQPVWREWAMTMLGNADTAESMGVFEATFYCRDADLVLRQLQKLQPEIRDKIIEK